MDDNYIKSLHYCPICGTVIGCGDGGCDSKQFRAHIEQCRLATRVKQGKLRHTDDNE